MGFPTTGILDTFTRADEGPPLGAPWGSKIDSDDAFGLQIISNAASGGGGGICSQVYDEVFGPDCEAFVTCATLAPDGLTWGISARIVNDGTASPDGYRLKITMASGAETWQLERVDDGAFTAIGSSNTQTLTAGDKVGLSIIGSALKGYHFTGGTWNQTPIVTATDATYGAAGKIGLRGFDSLALAGGWSFTDFGGGTIVIPVVFDYSQFPKHKLREAVLAGRI